MSTEARKLTVDERSNQSKAIDYSEIANSQSFKELLSKKKSFIVPMTIFFFVFYFALPVMTSYSKVLNTPAFGAITWAWVFAFAQFIMTWVLCILYTKKAQGFDEMVNKIVEKTIKKGGN